MAKLKRANQSYWAGNNWIKEGTVMHVGHPHLIDLYVDDFELPDEPTAAEEPKRGPGRPRKNGE